MDQKIVAEIRQKRVGKVKLREERLSEARRLDFEIGALDEVLEIMGVAPDGGRSSSSVAPIKRARHPNRISKAKLPQGFSSGWQLALHLLKDSGEQGLRPKQIIQKAKLLGADLKRKTIASQLSVAVKERKVGYDNGLYFHPDFIRDSEEPDTPQDKGAVGAAPLKAVN